ncbi:transposase [Chakrabartyella piscis]|uniref:transposase n=1 Tax=Chakrabartyella piscis TaxID=2918914 RepID=UPI0029589B91|nr:transposase [Chakrabartyella piscis]
MELPKRKQLRLQEYDYSQNGVYFVTICTHNKKCVLGDIETNTDFVGDGVTHRQRSGGHCRWLCLQSDEQDIPFVMLSQYGKIVEQTIQNMIDTYNDVEISKYVIMPNHIHMIIHIEQQLDNGLSRTPTPTRANQRIPSLVPTLKRFSNKKCSKSIWQRGYHDNVIRTQTSYEEIWQYIDTNPLKWELDKYHMES